MTTQGQSRPDWTVVLRRRPVRMVEGRAEGGWTGEFEIVCCACGDDPDLDYREVAPRAAADPRGSPPIQPAAPGPDSPHSARSNRMDFGVCSPVPIGGGLAGDKVRIDIEAGAVLRKQL